MQDAIFFEKCGEAARREDALTIRTHHGWPARLVKLEAQLVHNRLSSWWFCELKIHDVL